MAARKKGEPPKTSQGERKGRKRSAQVEQRKRQCERKAAFLAELKNQGSVLHACKVAGMGRTTAYWLRERDEEFAQAWDECLNVVIDEVEDSAVKRARDGWLEPVWHKGKQVGQVRKWDTTLQIFVLRQRRPDKWAQAERTKIEHEGSVTFVVETGCPDPG